MSTDSPAPGPRRPHGREPDVSGATGQPPSAVPPEAGPPEAGPAEAAGPSQDAVDAAAEVLGRGGAPRSLAGQAVAVLGARAGALLVEDPWLVLSVPGVRVEQADAFARALAGPGVGPDDPRRARALVSWLLERAAVEGHTALESSAVRSALASYRVADPDAALREAVGDGGVLVFQEDEPGPGDAAPSAEAEEGERPVRVLLGLDRYALAEESLADGLVRLLSTLDEAEPRDWEGAAEKAPSPSAAELVRAAGHSGLTLHTGGEAARPEAVSVVAAAASLGLRAHLAAVTEDSVRRLRSGPLPAGSAVTVADLLSGRGGPGRAEDGTLALDVLAVCDAPQLDVEAAASLVESLPDGARLILSGDPNTLWSAGAGRVFADLLAARVCPQVASRTPDPGPIGELVSGVGVGELPPVEAPGKEVVLVPVKDAGEAVHRTVQLVADSIPRAIGVPVQDILVITPGHGGAAGTRALNTALKARLNPGPGRFGGFDPGDRVVHVPAPGRAVPGTVVSAEPDALVVDCGGEPLRITREQVGQLRLGWALTAHQAVGLRRAAVVAVLPGDAARALTRQWVYTAFGRAERHLSVVQGVEQSLPRAVAEVPARPRTTRLRSVLLEHTAAAGG